MKKRILSMFMVVAILLSMIPSFAISSSAYVSGDFTYSTGNGGATIINYTGSSINLEIPSTIDGYTVMRIGNNAFAYCDSLQSIIIPDGVISIGEYAFYDCTSLQSITIPDSVTTIGRYAFCGCNSLQNITIPDGVASIGEFTFSECYNLQSIIIPDSVTTIDRYAFDYCYSLQNITIPDSVTSIGYKAFYNTAYYNDESNWENDVLYIGKHLIAAKTNISSAYTIKFGTKTIADYAFEFCDSLEIITIPDSVISISKYTFYKCTSLESVTIPDSVVSIGSGAFENCTSITSITIPDSVTSIGGYAFAYCDSLQRIKLSDSLTLIDKATFYQCHRLKNIRIPDSITSIGDYAFCGCNSLQSITIPDSVISIGNNAFWSCDSLQSVYYSGSATQWNSIYIYSYNNYLTNATIYFNSIKGGTGDIVVLNSAKNDITITPIDETVSDFFDMTDIKCTFGSNELVNDKNNKSFVIPYSKTNNKVILSKAEYQNYIIPSAVMQSWVNKGVEIDKNSQISYAHNAIMKDYQKDGKPYISTVFAREGSVKSFVNVEYEDLNVYEDKKYEIRISADNLNGKSCTYYIEQDANHKISNSTGVFSDIELFEKLDSQKTCYAYVKTADNEISELIPIKFKVQKELVEGESLGETLNLFGDDFLGVKFPEDVPLIGDAEISFEAFKLPAGVQFEGNTCKVSIGANIFKMKNETDIDSGEYGGYEKEFFDDWKDLCNKTFLDEYKKNSENYEKIKQNWEEKWFGLSGPPQKSKNFNIDALGYIEISFINGKPVIKDALLNLGGEFSFKYTQQGAIWVIPAYVYAEMGAYIGGSANGTRVVADKEIPFKFDWTLKIAPELTVGAGAGVKDIVSAGIYANATAPLVINFSDDHLKWDLNGEIGIEAEFIVLKGTKTVFDGSVNLVDHYWGNSATANSMYSAGDDLVYKTEVELVDRDYLENTSGWLNNSGMLHFYSVMQDGLVLTNLQTSVFNQAAPQIVTFGDKMLMTWVEDDANRDTYNRMRLMYSVYNNGIWSEPVPVCDDGKNDNNPVIVSDGKDVYFAWQKIDEIMTEENLTIEALVENAEIFTAKYDSNTNSIVDVNQVSENDCYDYAHNIAIINGSPVCYWASCIDNAMSTSNQNIIYRYEFGGESNAIANDKNYILSIDAASVNGKENVAFSMDDDGDTSSTNDITVYTLVDGVETLFDKGENNVAYTNAFFGDFNGEETLFVSDMTNIYYIENGETKTVFDSNSSISGNFNYIVKDDIPYLFWTEKEEVGNAVYTSSYENDKWSSPVRVSNTGTQLSSVDIIVHNNAFKGVCTSSELVYNETKQLYEIAQTNLCSFQINEVQDISIDDIYIEEENIAIGEETEFEVCVTNNGTEQVNEVVFCVCDSEGYSETITQNVNLQPGEGKFVSLVYKAPEDYSYRTLSVSVSSDNIIDSNSENDIVTKEIGKSNIVLTESEVLNVDGQYIITATVTNESDVSAENINLDILFNDDVTVIDTVTIDSIAPRENQIFRYVISENNLIFENDNDYCKFNIVVDKENSTISGNKICYIIEKSAKLECSHPLIETVETKEPTCTEEGQISTVCQACGEALESESVSALGHDYATEYTIDLAPTCTTEGSKSQHCSRCDSKKNVTVISANGHTSSDWFVDFEPTCTTNGSKHKDCKICGGRLETESIAPLGHTSSDWIIDYDSTCTENGSKHKECTVCGEVLETESIDPVGHRWGDWIVGGEPTCTDKGLAFKACGNCDEMEYKDIDALGHDYADEYTVDKQPTHTEAGSKSRHCSRCVSTTNVTAIEKLYYKSKTYTGLYKVDGVWHYVKNGELDNSFTGLVKYSGKWYHVKDGVKTTYTGLVKHTDGKYYYVKSGVKTSFNGLVKYNSKWYYVKSGVVNTSYTGLVKHTDGKYYYVKSGVKTSFNGLVKYNGKWYYVKSGVVNTSYTGLVKHTDGKWYYVKKGIKTSYTGTVTYNGKKYKVVKGVKV